jgi:hypothetical protein
MSVRALAWLGGIDSFGRGETTRPALQHEGLFTGHAPDGGQQPHRPPAHGASMIGVAEAHSGSSCGSAGATCPRRDAERLSAGRRGGALMGGGGMSLLVGLDRTPTRTSWGVSNERRRSCAGARRGPRRVTLDGSRVNAERRSPRCLAGKHGGGFPHLLLFHDEWDYPQVVGAALSWEAAGCR